MNHPVVAEPAVRHFLPRPIVSHLPQGTPVATTQAHTSARYGRSMPSTQMWQDWCYRFDALHDSILDLFHSRRVWREILTMIETNPDVHRSGITEHWLTRCYAASQMIAIRRQLDRDSKTASLWRSLDVLARNPAMATRSWFAAQLDKRVIDPRHLMSIAATFDQFARPCEDSVNGQLIRKDADLLATVGSTARAIVNKVFAHHEYRPSASSLEITWGEFDDAIDTIGDLYKKYYQLRRPGVVLGNLIPDLPAGWDLIFTTAWKPPNLILPPQKS